jgi:serine/threonine-protein kinase
VPPSLLAPVHGEIGQVVDAPATDMSASRRPGLPRFGTFARPPVLVSLALVGLLAAFAIWQGLHRGATVQSGPTTMTPPTPTAGTQASPAPEFAPPAHSVAVLPFVNMSGDPNQEYFSDGISEELLDALSRFNDIQVVARTSSFSFKGKDVDVATIARKLNVGAVLEGSVRRSADTVRITVQLVNAVTGYRVWAHTYDKVLKDTLKVQTEVATSVAGQLEVKLAGDEAAKIELGGTKNGDAYDSYLRGLHLYEEAHDTEHDYREALAAFDRAISLDPKFAMAYARRAAALDYIYKYPDDPRIRPDLISQARAAAKHAVALAPQLGEAHLVLAYADYRGAPDLAEAAREYNLALALAPGSAWVQRGFGWFASYLGHFDIAVTAARRAVTLDPQGARTRQVLAEVLLNARRYGEALKVLDEARLRFPDSHPLESLIPLTLIASGQIEKARMTCESPSMPLDAEDRYYCLALVYHALGRQADAERELEKFKAAPGHFAEEYALAGLYAQWGDKEAALRWLTEAEHLHNFDLIAIKVDWMLDPIRNEPQFKAIDALMHFPP